MAGSERGEGAWQQLYAQNRTVVGDDPDLIFPGQRLTLRGKAAPQQDRRTATTARPDRPAEKVRPEAAPKPAPKTAPRTRPAPKPAPAPKPKTAPRPASKPAPAQKPRTEAASFAAPVAAGPSTAYRKTGSSWSSGYHTGVDFAVPTGTSVKAVASGKVVSAGWGGAYGYEIVIRHSDGRYSQYAHLSALTVRAGQQVSAGQRIARSGSTGNSTGPHLHFEIRTGPGYGSDIDPLAYLRARGVSV
jgi:murein DD-endopeptidase MepM/ murein hydrolase activator NlpD